MAPVQPSPVMVHHETKRRTRLGWWGRPYGRSGLGVRLYGPPGSLDGTRTPTLPSPARSDYIVETRQCHFCGGLVSSHFFKIFSSVGDGHGGAVVLVAGRVALASCVTPRGAGTNLNDSDAAA